MSNQTAKNYEVESDNQGNWSFNLDKNLLDSGSYNITTEDVDGNRQEKSIVIFRDEKVVESRIPVDVIRSNVLVLILFGAIVILILLLAANIAVLSKKKNKKIEKDFILNIKRRFSLGRVAFVKGALTVFLILIFYAGIYFVNNYKAKVVYHVDISNYLVDPVTSQGFEGVDVSFMNTSIRTDKSGQFSFSQVPTTARISMTYPLLKKTISKEIFKDEEKGAGIHFSPDMYNAIIEIVDIESRGDYGKIYQYLHPKIKQKTSASVLQKEYKSIFDIQNVGDQELVVAETEKLGSWLSKRYDIYFENAFLVKVRNGSKTAEYRLVYEDGSWWLLR